MRVRRLSLLLVTLLLLSAAPAAGADGPEAPDAGGGYQQVVDLTFPVGGDTTYSDTYDAPRGSGRVHRATDLMAAEGTPVHAAVGGTVEWLTGVGEPIPSFGYMIRIAGDDGRDYAYVHLGRQDGPPTGAYAPGVAGGQRVARGQHIGFVGCSGNASCDAPHLHFEIHDESVTDPYDGHRINPYASLLAAEREGDYAAAVVRPFDDIADSVHLAAIVELADAGIVDGCGPRRFCPNDPIARTTMAQVLARALDVPPADTDHFSDDDGLDAEPAINALAAAGVVEGCRDGTVYCPDGPVTRARMASYLARAFALAATEADFFDDDDGHHHEDNINRLAAAGVTVGCTPERFCVRGSVTRGQIASFVARGLGDPAPDGSD